MTDDATQGDWQPLADQPILPDEPAADRGQGSGGAAGTGDAERVVWAKPPDDAGWAKPPDDAGWAKPPDDAGWAKPPDDAGRPVSPHVPVQPPAADPPVAQDVPAPYAGPSPYPAGYPAAGYPPSGPVPDYLESAPRRRPPTAGIVGLAVIAALILAGLAFAVSGGSPSESATSAGTAASKSAIPRPAAGPLDRYLLSPSDVGPGTDMALVPDGRSLSGAGGVTLDFCDAKFASEKSRAERVQAQYDGSAGTVSNEVVRYKPGGADAAFAEIKKAVSTCDTGYQDGTGTVSHIQQPTGFTGLAPQHVVVSFEQQLSDQEPAHSFWVTCVYQFDGDYFSGVYVYGADLSSARELAVSLAKKAAGYLKEAAGGSPGTGGGNLEGNSPGNGAPGLPA